jgi:Holliday junction resolvase-like predicted endonuclease
MASKKLCWRKGDKGLWGERFAVKWLATKNLKRIYTRQKIWNTEIDLIAIDLRGDLHLIEVKTLFYEKPRESWIGHQQIHRIRRALSYLIEKETLSISKFSKRLSAKPRGVRAHLMVVKAYNRQIEWFTDFFTPL